MEEQNWISQLSEQQCLELVRCMASTAQKLTIDEKYDDYLLVTCQSQVIDDDGEFWVEDSWELRAYDLESYEWPSPDLDELIAYRKKMLEWFGTDYAVSYLLSGQ